MPILGEGVVVCDQCQGVFPDKYNCPKCLGEGRLDWVEKIVGRRIDERENDLIYHVLKSCGEI